MARLVIFTSCQREEEIYRAIRAGAQGYLFKNASVEDLVESIRTVAAGESGSRCSLHLRTFSPCAS